MARYSAKAAAEQVETSTTSTSVSSMPFVNSNACSTFGTPFTSAEDDEEFNFQRKPPAKITRATRARRKRSAESDDGNPSVSAKPATKRRAIINAAYVEIPAPSANVSVGIGPDSHGPRLIVIAHLKSSKDKGKGKAPSNFVDGLEDGMVPDSEVDLGYRAVAPEDESDDGDSDFEVIDIEDEDDSDIPFFGVRKMPRKRTSRPDTRYVDNTEEVDAMMLAAATEASMRDFMSGGASTIAGPSGHDIPGLTGPTVPVEINYVDYGVVSDSEPEGDLLEPIVEIDWMPPAKGKGRNKSQWYPEYNADDTPQDPSSVRREARRQTRLEKQEVRILEYRLGRRLTHVGLADIFLFHDLFLLFFLLDSGTGRKIYNSVTKASP